MILVSMKEIPRWPADTVCLGEHLLASGPGPGPWDDRTDTVL